MHEIGNLKRAQRMRKIATRWSYDFRGQRGGRNHIVADSDTAAALFFDPAVPPFVPGILSFRPNATSKA
jgi:hypothetical protein